MSHPAPSAPSTTNEQSHVLHASLELQGDSIDDLVRAAGEALALMADGWVHTYGSDDTSAFKLVVCYDEPQG